jgi:hypothetical protein
MFSLFIFAPSISYVGAQVNLTPEICDREYADPADVPTVCREISATGETNTIYGRDGILTRAINALSFLVGVLSVIVIIIAGIKLTIYGSDPAKVKTARNQIIYALIGIVVVIAAQSIVRFVLYRVK